MAETSGLAAQSAALATDATISQRLAAFAAELRYGDIPEDVRERAKYLILDSVGIALASTRYDFAQKILDGIRRVAGPGDSTVIGVADRLPLRDAILANGALIHGLDFDDTHMEAIIHATSSALPCALGAAEHVGASGRDLLTAYVIGMETGIRIGAAAQAGFHHVGFHATGVVGHFSSALIAGRLFGLEVEQLATVQGIAGSTAAASQEFLDEAAPAWNKRLHPGWGGLAAITAVGLAQSGFQAPSKPYEGRYGLFKTYLGPLEEKVDYDTISAGLGERWELVAEAVKPYPVCHFTHGCADSAIEIHNRHGLKAEDITRVRAMVPGETLPIVSEPIANKKRPSGDYEAKFSTQFITAACLLRGRFGLAELEPEALNDPEILALADKVECEADAKTEFPRFFSGGVVVSTRDGNDYVWHEPVNSGAGERALNSEAIAAKFMANATMAVPDDRAARIRDLVLGLDETDARGFAMGLAG